DLACQSALSPTVHLFAPSSEELTTTNKGTLVCLMEDFYPGSVEVQWVADGSTINSGVVTSPAQRQSNNKYMASSYLSLEASQWQSYNSVSCKVRHEAGNVEKTVSRSDTALGKFPCSTAHGRADSHGYAESTSALLFHQIRAARSHTGTGWEPLKAPCLGSCALTSLGERWIRHEPSPPRLVPVRPTWFLGLPTLSRGNRLVDTESPNRRRGWLEWTFKIHPAQDS
uniref:Ig-like domain-containing protein n=1 Tax=Malurus cyaneus samueli TaxID=2593467 RepID=A0A8C5X8C8_9PASS